MHDSGVSNIQKTYKSQETEEKLDIILYRPWGYAMALASKKIGLTPNQITIIGTIFGTVAGHLYFYKNPYLIALGIFFLMLSQALDSTDGQLARMTNNMSKIGRILDGFGTNVIFVSIYIHLCVRMMMDGTASWWIWLIAALAGASHSIQSALADYYRNLYLRFVISPTKGELETAEQIKVQYDKISWKNNFAEKFLMRVYLNYTVEQEVILRSSHKLKVYIDKFFGGVLPEYLSPLYRKLSKPNVKYYNILTTNTRMIALFIALIFQNFYIFFLFEIFVLNALAIYVYFDQEKTSRRIFAELQKEDQNVNAAAM